MPVLGMGWGIRGLTKGVRTLRGYWGLHMTNEDRFLQSTLEKSRWHWGLHMTNEDRLLQSTLEKSRWSIADNRT